MSLEKLILSHTEYSIILLSIDYEVIEFNESSELLFGVPQKSIVGKNIFLACKKENIQLPFTNNDLKNNALNIPVFSENCIIFSDKKKRFVRWKSVYHRQKKSTFFVIIIQDISDLVASKNNISDIYLKGVVENLPEYIYWKDKNFIYRGCNKHVAEYLGLNSPEDVSGKTDHDFNWSSERISELHTIDNEILKNKTNVITEDEIPGKDGIVRVMLTSKSPLMDNLGRVVGIVGVSTDITEQKEIQRKLKIAMEQAEAANKAKSEFIANMSHDVKTPLAGIISISEHLKTRVQEEYQDFMLDIMQAGRNLMTFFENCIELSKLERNATADSEECFSLKHLVNELLSLFRPTIKSKGLSMIVEYSEKIPSRLIGNRINLYRTILNLMGNAVKFTSHGSISLRAQLSENSTSEKAIIKLTIADSGIGIPKDKQGIIFEQFSRVTPSYEGIYEGSGIGLYIVQKFVKSMGGEIFVKSDEGKGSQFTVVIPFQIALLTADEYDDDKEINLSQENSPGLKTSSKKPTSNTVLSKMPIEAESELLPRLTVMLVEDNLMAQKSAAMLLASLNCQVDIADRGEKAIALFKPGKYDLIFMDIGLPDIKGYQVTARLREIEKETSFRAPILGLSAHATQEEKQLGATADMDKILSKPLLHDEAKLLLEEYVFNIKNKSKKTNPPIKNSNTKIIDLQLKPTNRDKEEKLGWDMLTELVASLPSYRANMEQAHKTHNLEILAYHVHKLHGELCYMKAPHLLQATKKFDKALKNGKSNQFSKLYKDMLKAMEIFEKEYQAFCSNI